MTTFRQTVLPLVMAAVAFGAYAQTDNQHVQHHPADSVKKAAVAKPKALVKESMAAMDSQMKVMREMHEKMMATKTPEERNALMADHAKAMQDGMSMMGSMASMGGMKGMGGMGGMDSGVNKGRVPLEMMAHHEMMEKRMEMMTSMMQMMMDRLPDDPAK